jgi:hypothetical protein
MEAVVIAAVLLLFEWSADEELRDEEGLVD